MDYLLYTLTVLAISFVQDFVHGSGFDNFSVEYELVPNAVKVYANTSNIELNATCIYDWDDKKVFHEFMTIIPGEYALVTKTYTKSGYYTMNAICITEDMVVFTELQTMYVGKAILQLVSDAVITTLTYPLTTDVELNIFQTGTDVLMNVTIFASNYIEKTSVSDGNTTLILPKTEFQDLGMYVVELSAMNLLTEVYIIHLIFQVSRPQLTTSVTLGPKPLTNDNTVGIAIKGEPFEITVDFVGDDNVTLIIELYHDKIIGYHCSGHLQGKITFPVTIEEAGIYQLNLTFANSYSTYYTDPIQMSVYQSLASIDVFFENTFSFVSEPLVVGLRAENESTLPPFSCNVDPVDGIHIYTVNTNTKNVTHIYTNTGYFNVTVKCVVETPELYVQYVPGNIRDFMCMIYREVPLTALVLEHDATNTSHYPSSRPLKFTVSSADPDDPSFSTITLKCTVDFGETSYQSQDFTGILSLETNMTFLLRLPGSGQQLNLTVNCSLSLSYQVFQPIQIYIFSACWQFPFFDAAYKDAAYPRVADLSKTYEVVANVKFTGVDGCQFPHELHWEVYDDQIQKVNITSPKSITFFIKPNTFQPKVYLFKLTSSFLGGLVPSTFSDITYVKFEYAHLQAVLTNSLTDTLVRKVLQSQKIVIDSTLSYDPADPTSSNSTNHTLGKIWSCFQCPPNTQESDITVYTITDYKPYGAKTCEADPFIGGHEQGMYIIAPYVLSLRIWYIFELSVYNNNRSSLTRQALYVYDKQTLTLDIACIRNCIEGYTHRYKLRRDTVELNVNILNMVDHSSAKYLWKFEIFNPVYNTFIDISDRIIDSRETSGFKLSGTSFEGDPDGSKYQVSCEVYLAANDTYDKTTVYRQFAMNMAPYNGTCEIEGGVTEVNAGTHDVCFTCKNWKDEGKRESRDIIRDVDDGRSLKYDVNQIYLHQNKTINTNLKPNFLTSSLEMFQHMIQRAQMMCANWELIFEYYIIDNLRRCVRLRLPEDGVGYTMIQVEIQDEFERPSAVKQFILKVKNPLVNGTTMNVTQVHEAMDSTEDAINNVLEIGDIQTLLQIVDSMASVMFSPDLGYDPMTFDTAGISDMKADGTQISASEAVAELDKPQLTAYEEALLEAKVGLLEHLVQSQASLTSSEKTKVSTKTMLTSAVTSLLQGSDKTINNTILNGTGTVLDNIIAVFPAMAEDNFGSEEFSELSEGLVRAIAAVTDALVPDDIGYYIDVDNQADARHLNNELSEVSADEFEAKLEASQLTEDERNYFLTKRQLQLRAEIQSKESLNRLQAARINDMLANLVSSTDTCDGCTTVIGDEQTSRVVISRLPKELIGDTTVYGTTATVKLSNIDTYDDKVSIGMYEGNKVVHQEPSGSFSTITSKEVYLNFATELAISAEQKITITFKVPLPSYTLVEPVVMPEDADKLHRQNVFLRRPDESLCLVIKPLAETVSAYKLWVSCSGSVTKLNYDATAIVNRKNGWKNCFTPGQLDMDKPGTCNYGIETILQESTVTIPTDNTTEQTGMNLTAATMNFKVWDEAAGVWRNDHCGMVWEPDDGHLIGECPTNKKITFANSFYVPINTIDFKAAFLKFSPENQAAVLGTLATLFVAYIFVILWARRADKNDLLKWGITPLADNFAVDNYYYVIRVYTGLRPGAGTRARIGLIVIGEETDTGLRELSDGIRKEFTTGSVMNFLMSTPVCLGYLEYIRLWNYSSGASSDSWYISKLEIQDVQCNVTFTFLAERWLAIDKEDGLLECVIPVCHSDNLNTFRNRFYGYTKDTLADSHIWVSVLYRPESSHATRVHRSLCALVFILLTMLSNAMFYNGENEYETQSPIQAGPLRLSTHQIYTSIISALITTPITMLIFYMFKYSKPSPCQKCETKEDNMKSKCFYKIPFIESRFERLHKQSLELERKLLTKGYPKSEGFSLPPCFLWAARILVTLSVLLSAFLLLLYSMEWGKQKSEEWLSSFFLSFIESVLFLDPIKVIALALIVAIIFRNVEHPALVIDRHTVMQMYESGHHQKAGELRMPAPPIDNERLQVAKKIREREKRMKTALKDFIVNLFIIWITFSIGYSTKDRWAYFMQKEVVDSLLHARNPGQIPFAQVKTIEQYYDWLENTTVQALFPEHYVSGHDLHWRLKQFMQDGAKLRVGPPRLRQIRSKQKKCKNPYIDDKYCNTEYEDSTEDTTEYCIGWKSPPCHSDELVYKHSSDAWKFTSAFDIWGIPVRGHYSTYGGGGYIVKLSVNRDISQRIIDELFNSSWIDSRTRAVAFEFTLYCINANLFTYNIFLTEFPATGGVFQHSAVFPLRLHMHNGSLGLYTLACECIFIVYLIFITVFTGMDIYQQKKEFFKNLWRVYDFVFISISYVTIIMYFLRICMTNKALGVFKADKKEFVNFVHIALWDQMYTLFIGILVFMSTLRMLNILGYNKRITAVANVFTYAANELIWFGVFFFYIIISNAVFGYLLFGSQLASYRDVYKSMGTLFVSMIGKSRFTEIEEKDPIMSKVYFMMFVISVVYIILTMFLAILSMSIDQVQKDMKGDRDEMVDFILNKFKAFLSYFGGSDNKSGDKHDMYEHPLPWGMNENSLKLKKNSPYIISELRTSLKDGAIYKKKVRPQTSTTFHAASILKMEKGKKMMLDFK